jgi:hypothetical protein
MGSLDEIDRRLLLAAQVLDLRRGTAWPAATPRTDP